MMSEQIIRTFLKHGMLLSRSAFGEAEQQQNLEEVVKKLPKTLVVKTLKVEAPAPVAPKVETKPQPKIETKPEQPKPLQSAFAQAAMQSTMQAVKPEPEFNPEYKVLKSFQPTEKTSVMDVIKQNSERFEFLRKILAEKYELENLTTINKLSNFGEASVIGEVRAVEEKVVTLEDATGTVKILFEDVQRVFVGDVIGVHGLVRKEYLVSRKITFPDMPLRRSVGTAKREAKILVANVSEKNKSNIEKIVLEKKPNYVLNHGAEVKLASIHVGNNKSKAELMEIEGLNFVKLSLEDKMQSLGDDALLEVLKRRSVKYGMENFLIESPPDILTAVGKPVMKNYKGTTVLQCDESRAFLVNLQTREVEEINL